MPPLDGIKVLDFSRVYVGPSCSQVLGDLGADVYKVESIGLGDFSRHFMVAEDLEGESHSFLGLNRNKMSICLDLRQPEAKEIVFKLVEICDVVLQNFRPDVMGRLGLDYNALKQHNPKIIYASASGYGLTGPYQMKAGQDLVAQAMSGVGWLTGERNGPPFPCGAPIADYIGGMLLVQVILAALWAREKTSEGQEVSVSLLDGMFPPQCEPATAYLSSGQLERKITRPMYRFYQTKDEKWMVLVGAFRENPLRDICEVLGLPDLSQDERFNTWEKVSYEHADELEAMFAERLRTKTRDEWIKLLEEKDILCGPVYTHEEAFSDPQVLHNEMVIEFDHPRAGKVRTVGMPIKFSKTPGKVRIPPPLLGQHTDEVLAMVGYSNEQIQQLRDTKVVA